MARAPTNLDANEGDAIVQTSVRSLLHEVVIRLSGKENDPLHKSGIGDCVSEDGLECCALCELSKRRRSSLLGEIVS